MKTNSSNPECSFARIPVTSFIHAYASATANQSGAVNIALEAQAQNNSIQTTLNWGNSSTVTYSGKLAAVAHFIREQKEANENKRKLPPLKTVIDVQPTNVILNDTLWDIHPSQVVLDSGKDVCQMTFYFSHKDRHLRINGTRFTTTSKIQYVWI